MKPCKRKQYKAGHKFSNTLLTSIRVGHSKLNSDTHKLGLSDSNLCPHCKTPETALHFITKCPHFAEQRQTVLDQIEQHFIPKFKSLSFNRQFEILVEGYDPDNPELKRIWTQKSKHLHKHSYFKQSVFWISQQHPSHPPPSLDSPSFNLQFHNSQFTNYLFSHSSFFPLFITPLSFSFLSISSGGCDVRVVDGIPLLWAFLPNSQPYRIYLFPLFCATWKSLQFKIKRGNTSCEVHMDL